MSLNDPEQRKRAINDAVKRVLPEKKLNEKQVALLKAQDLSKRTADHMVQVLRALPNVSAFDQQGTEQLVFDYFRSGFDKWTREEMIFLLGVMHTNILMEAIEARVHAGLVGPYFDAKD